MDEIVEQPVVPTVYPSLQETPEFREAYSTHSKNIEEILKKLEKGTPLYKIRSFSKSFRRTYFLDKNGNVKYYPSKKALCMGSPTIIEVDEIFDVRKGWKTDVFNKIAKKVEEKPKGPNEERAEKVIRGSSSIPISKGKPRSTVDESRCFSIVHGKNKKSLDLMAQTPEVAEMWVKALGHLVTVIKSLQQEKRFDKWLKQQFVIADIDQNGCLNFEECLKLLVQLNCEFTREKARQLFENANTNKNTRNGEQVLDSDEFLAFFNALTSRPEIDLIFKRYTKDGKEMDTNQLCQFLRKEQHLENVSEKDCAHWIAAHEPSEIKSHGKMSVIGFTHLLMSEDFEIFMKKHKVVYQDMTQPLTHYYIASSHNTYLTGNQISGESSVEGYIDALKRGCRCVEMDCYDGPDGDPIIYHGFTLTSKILFKDVLQDAIKPYAFEVSEYPLIISLENHCKSQQDKIAGHMKNILGDLLYEKPIASDIQFLPSPESLKHKIILKAKKLKPGSDNKDESSGEEDPEVKDASTPKTKQSMSQALSDLVNICQPVHFISFEQTKLQGKCYQMSSFSESKALKLIETRGTDFVQYNQKHLSRIYPAGTRTSSSNFKPTPFWNVGCQLVALNYQDNGKPIFINEAKFRQNGGCGFILKPTYLTRPSSYDPKGPLGTRSGKIFVIKIISGQHIPKPNERTEGEIVDPYVKVKIVGHPDDICKFKTSPVRNNGFNPKWDEVMTFHVKMYDLAMVHFIVKDENTTGKDATLGTYALPLTSIGEGYRHIFLMNYTRNYVSPASLFVHVSIQDGEIK